MDSDAEYITINLDIFHESTGIGFRSAGVTFLASIGLKFISLHKNNNKHLSYVFKITNKKLWFLSKIKYGL